MKKIVPQSIRTLLGQLWLVGLLAAPAAAEAAPTAFNNIAAGDGAGIGYRRIKSTTDAAFDAIKILPFYALPELIATPLKSHGQPGVVLTDYDNDGDVDIYVTNGPGRANSLYQNRLKQGGGTTFIDVGVAAGVDALTQDSTGACAGDIDNDGDQDLLVLGRMESNRLYRNNGNGTYTDITPSAGVGGGALGHASCSMGDINGDGLLDIAVANTFDWARQDAIFNNAFAYNHANQLYVNQGGNVFSDVSATSGIYELHNVPQGDATISWAVALVDYDQDGDLDLIHADDQAAFPPAAFRGVNRGFVQVFRNDGTGHFVNVTQQTGMNQFYGAWMSLAFGDLNHDGQMDIFASNFGDNSAPLYGFPIPPGLISSRLWYFQGGAGGKFSSPIPPNQVQSSGPTTPFGWGSGMADYDNDTDSDVIFFGSLDNGPFISADNPGTVLENDGTGNVGLNFAPFAASSAQTVRGETMGVALGDLNDDGFVDAVHVSAQQAPDTIPLLPTPWRWSQPGQPVPTDPVANYLPTFVPMGPTEWEWAGANTTDGLLSVEINNKGSGNNWVKVRVKGTKGLTTLGKVNRDGIGAIVKFTPKQGKTALYPVVSGGTHASQHDLGLVFGLGSKTKGTLDITWPGGVKNRLYDVERGERVTFPEIPCNYDGSWPSENAYRSCVNTALNQLVASNTITSAERTRLRESAYEAYDGCH